MDVPKVDLSNADDVVREVMEDDNWVKEEFFKHLGDELKVLAQKLAACYQMLPRLNEAADRAQTEQAALVVGFAYGVLDDILVSTKLLFAGKLMPAGNLMRQAAEGIAVAVLCVSRDLLILDQPKGGPVPARYYEKMLADDPRTEGHKAIGQLSWNRTTLGVSEGGVKGLKRARDRYNAFSHTGKFAIAARVALGKEGQVYAGGHFDVDKVEGYRIELAERIALSEVLPNFFEVLTFRLDR